MATIITIPNAISFTRLPMAGMLMWFAWQGNMTAALITLVIAGSSDILDGYVARKYNMSSKFGQDVLEPICDMALASAAVAGLVIASAWSIWVAIALLTIAALLQLISVRANQNQFWGRLKRHQNWIHPLYAVIVVTIAIYSYIWLALEGPMRTTLIAVSTIILAVIASLRGSRLRQLWVEGQQWPKSAT